MRVARALLVVAGSLLVAIIGATVGAVTAIAVTAWVAGDGIAFVLFGLALLLMFVRSAHYSRSGWRI